MVDELTVRPAFPRIISPLSRSYIPSDDTGDKSYAKSLTVCTTTELPLGRDFSKAYEPMVVGMPSEGAVLMESCMEHVRVQLVRPGEVYPSHLNDDWNAMKWTSDFACRSLLVQSTGNGEDVLLRRRRNDCTKCWAGAVVLCDLIQACLHKLDAGQISIAEKGL